MKVQVKYANGYTGSLPNVHWHPEYTQESGHPRQPPYHFPAGLWVRESDIRKFMNERDDQQIRFTGNPIFEERGKHITELIEFAEADIEVYQDDHNEQPWRHNGTRSAIIHGDMPPAWWDKHA